MTKRTKVKDLSRAELMSILNMSMTWCKKNMGINKRKKSCLRLSVTKSDMYMGQYNPYENKLVIYHNTHKYIMELLSTFIHEYVHYLQPCLTKYGKILKEVGYDNHPFEIEARQIETELAPVLMKYIAKKVKKNKN